MIELITNICSGDWGIDIIISGIAGRIEGDQQTRNMDHSQIKV